MGANGVVIVASSGSDAYAKTDDFFIVIVESVEELLQVAAV